MTWELDFVGNTFTRGIARFNGKMHSKGVYVQILLEGMTALEYKVERIQVKES